MVANLKDRERLVGKLFALCIAIFGMSVYPTLAFAAEAHGGAKLDLTSHWVGYMSIAVFVAAYVLVMLEEVTHLRKSKPVILAAGVIWAFIAWEYANNNLPHAAEVAVRHNILEYAELFLFLLVAMTYINAMGERRVFMALRSWMVHKGFSLKQLFWLTGVLAFFISPIADNLTTALLMCAVIMAVDCTKDASGKTTGCVHPKFVLMACINIVVAANAGGAFSPFGDITTLMVWQKGIVQFTEFFALFVPSVVNWIIPAVIMSFFLPDSKPKAADAGDVTHMKPGAMGIVFLFLMTIATAVAFHNFLHLPPMLGMMTGLAYLQFYSYYLRKIYGKRRAKKYGFNTDDMSEATAEQITGQRRIKEAPLEVFEKVAMAEWDTLLFFFGVVLAVGGLGFIGYLAGLSQIMYADLGPTNANILVGILSAIVDNIPVMFAVLTMKPEMSALGTVVGPEVTQSAIDASRHAQWLLVTLTAGVGGSLLSIGSAAGVALMGQARGFYTFGGHLKWMPAIALGYAASIWVHILLNGS